MQKRINLIVTAILLCLLSSTSHANELKSNVFLLVDFSNSYFRPERVESQIQRNIEQFSSTVSSKRDGPKKPALIQVLPINAISEASAPICEYKLLRRRLLGGKKKCGAFPDAFCSTKLSELKEYLDEECSEIVLSTPVEYATDISGALALTSQLIDSQGADDSYVVIFSDMFEYRLENLPLSKIDLKGAKVRVVCGGGFNEETDVIKLCSGTEDIWRSKLAELGASSIEYTIETSRWADGKAKGFFR